MKNFRYEAVDIKGNIKEGILKANTGEEAIFKLMKCSLYPLAVEELSGHNLIAHTRLEKLKKIREVLSPRQYEEESVEPKSSINLSWLWILVGAMLLFSALVCYLLYEQ